MCNYDQTLDLSISEEAIDSDIGHMDCILKCGSVSIPIQIQDEIPRRTVLTGKRAFKMKYLEKKSLEYRDGKIILGTQEFYPHVELKKTLIKEALFVDNEWYAMDEDAEGCKEFELTLPGKLAETYKEFLGSLKKKRTLPSLAYYTEDILLAAKHYVEAINDVFSSIEPGDTLSAEQNNSLLLGCVIKSRDEHLIKMSPLHPLNVLYQIKLLDEENVGSVRENLIEKLSALYLIPFIRDQQKKIYHPIEQQEALEWRYYAPVSNVRFQGSRNYVQKLVCNKIEQYKEHFPFLFDDLRNNQMFISLVNMGDCHEIFQGLLRYYALNLRKDRDPDELLCFVVNIYTSGGMENDFALLSDQYQLKEYIKKLYPSEDVSDLVFAMTGRIRCYYRSPREAVYQYAHLTFYEMTSSEDTGASRMDNIVTGISLSGLLSGTPSVLNGDWYKTGFGTRFAEDNELIKLASYYNAMYRVAFSGSSYEPNSTIFTEIEQGQEEQLKRIYTSSNWVVFVEPKVDLSFFQSRSDDENEVMIIHYSDQYTSASGYEDITVTQKAEQYNNIILEQLQKKGVSAEPKDIRNIISLFNAINGSWLLRLIAAKKIQKLLIATLAVRK